MLEVCKYMHWDYWTYTNQPMKFVNLIRARIIAEKQYNDYLIKKNGR